MPSSSVGPSNAEPARAAHSDIPLGQGTTGQPSDPANLLNAVLSGAALSNPTQGGETLGPPSVLHADHVPATAPGVPPATLIGECEPTQLDMDEQATQPEAVDAVYPDAPVSARPPYPDAPASASVPASLQRAGSLDAPMPPLPPALQLPPETEVDGWLVSGGSPSASASDREEAAHRPSPGRRAGDATEGPAGTQDLANAETQPLDPGVARHPFDDTPTQLAEDVMGDPPHGSEADVDAGRGREGGVESGEATRGGVQVAVEVGSPPQSEDEDIELNDGTEGTSSPEDGGGQPGENEEGFRASPVREGDEETPGGTPEGSRGEDGSEGGATAPRTEVRSALMDVLGTDDDDSIWVPPATLQVSGVF